MTSPNPTLYIDPDTSDIYVSPLGQCRLTADLSEEVAQRLDTKFKFFLGEWFLDQSLGVPYYRDVFVRNPDMAVIRSIFQQLITDDAGVESLVSLDLALDGETRALSVTFQAVLVSDEVLGPLTFKSLV